MNSLTKTALFEEHLKRGARMVPFAGWSMPVQYTGILEEHKAVRSAAGLFDVSHMGQFWVKGKDALPYLRFLLTNDIAKCKKKSAMYSPMCYPDGGVIDDLIVYHVDEHTFFVCVNASNTTRDFDWMTEQCRELNVELTNVSASTSLLALQGPKAEAILGQLHAEEIHDLPFRGFIQTKLLGQDALIARTGYTGEDGFEIYVPNETAAELWSLLLETGRAKGLLPAGLGARDLLRLEMGYPLYGHELDEKHTPIASQLGWTVKLENHEFVGRDAIEEEMQRGPLETLIYFNCQDRRIPRDRATITVDGQSRGTVVSGGFSPSLEHSIASGFLQWNVQEQGPLPKTVQVQVRDQWLTGTITNPPFITGTSLKSRRLATKK